MAAKRYAVLVGSSLFPNEPLIEDLRLPENDVDGLDELLNSEERGQFDETLVLKNRPSYEVLREVNQLFSRVERDDFVLFYYSGHGKLNLAGNLFLATPDTSIKALEATSIPVQSIKNFADVSAASRVALLLDCCYSGAAGAAFARGNVDDHLQLMSGGRGTYIMTASTGVQTALERESDQYGIFTKHIIEGIQGGGADQNDDGYISMDELYTYVRDHIREDGAQQPMKWDLNVSGTELIISRSGRKHDETRRNQIRSMVLDLAGRDILPNSIVADAMHVISAGFDSLSAEEMRHEALLVQLLEKKLTVADFIEDWFGGAISAPSIPTISPTLPHIESRPPTERSLVKKTSKLIVTLAIVSVIIWVSGLILLAINVDGWDDQDVIQFLILEGVLQTPIYVALLLIRRKRAK